MKNLGKLFVIAGLAAFSSQVSADSIHGWWNPVNNSADFSWHVDNEGMLVVAVENTSTSATITGFQFQLDDGSVIDHLVDVSGTRNDAGWGYLTGSRGCYTGSCMMTGRNFWQGRVRNGIAAGQTGELRFFGDFLGLGNIRNLIVRFQGGWRNRDVGWGCRYGCAASEVPEPGTLALFGLGLLGFAVAWRRRRLQPQAI